MRNLTKALAAISLLLPATGHALGIGDIKLQSALNQNLKAEISLVVSPGEEPSSINAKLASPEKFDEAGVPWSYFLSKIKFKTEKRSNGSVVIKLTSSEALREPFLDLLLEVTWPQGNIYREFTVLVDPPTDYGNSSADSVSKKPVKLAKAEKFVPPVKKRAEVSVEPIKTSRAKSSTTDILGSSEDNADTSLDSPSAEDSTAADLQFPVKDKTSTAFPLDVTVNDNKSKNFASLENKDSPNPISKNDKAAVAMNGADNEDKDGAPKISSTVSVPKKASVTKQPNEYGPTKKTANLYRIANEVNSYPGISVEQMMYAIYEANPDAFADHNIHTLRSGQLLKIPSRNAVEKVSRDQAIKELGVQTATKEADTSSHKTSAQQKTKSAPSVDKASKKPSEQPQKEVAASDNQPVKVKKSRRLKLRTPVERIIKRTQVIVSDAALQDENKKLVNANQDLQIQLRKMQDQLAAMEKLLVLKDQKLAMIEKSLKAKKEGKAILEDADLKNTDDALNKAQAVADAAKQATNVVAKKDITQPIDSEGKKAAIEKAKADAEAKAQAEAKAKAAAAALQAENDAKAAKAKADAEAKAQADAKAKADAAALKAKAEADAAAAKAKADAEAKAKAANSAPITPKPEDAKTKVDTVAKVTAANSAPTLPKPEDAKAATDAAAAKAKAEADAKAKADAAALKAKTEADAAAAKAKIDAEAKTKAQADADAKAKAEAAALKAKTEADIAKAKADAEAKAKADAVALKAKAEADAAIAKAKADADAKAKADAAVLKAKIEAEAAKVKADAEAKAKAEAAKAKIEAATSELKAKAAAKLQADADAKAKAKAEAEKADSPEPEVMPIHPKPLIIEPKPVEAEESWMPDPYILSVAGGGVIAIGLLGWLFWRKRKVESVNEVESMFTESSEISLPDDEDEFSVAGIEDNSSFMFGGESSFLSDDNDFDAFEVDQDEVDPISEADVYLAYGRYQQAEELMRQAIEEQPNRDECKLKLLEIFYANENAAAFEAYVTDLAGAGKAANKVFWSKVVEMGRGIIPDSPLLDVSAEEEEAEEVAEQGNQASDEDNFQVSDFESAMTEGFAEVSEQTNDAESAEQRISLEKSEDNQEDIDDNTEFDLSVFDETQPITEEAFDLSMFDEPESVAEKAVSEPVVEPPANNVEFDLSMFDEPEPVAKKAVSKPVTEVTQAPANNVEFDLSMFDEPESVAEKAVSEPVIEPLANNVEFDLSLFDEPESVAEKAVSEPVTEAPANNVEFDLSLFDEPESVAEKAVSEPVTETPANNVEFDLSLFDEPESVAEKAVSEPVIEPLANNVEFDLSMFNELPPVANKVVNEPVVSEPVANDLAMFDEVGAFSTSEEDDFDLSEFETADPGKEGINLEMAEAIIKEDEDAFDLSSFDVSEDEGADVAGFDATELNSENEDFDFSAFENAEEKTASASTDEAAAKDDDVLLDLSAFDASFDISEDDFFNTNVKSGLIADDVELATSLADNEPFDLTEMNVLETKIDLAKAYIDMGDAEAAKGILNKVLEEGTDEQKVAAASLLQNLK